MYNYYGLQKLPYAMRGVLWYVGLMNSGEMFLARSTLFKFVSYAGPALAARPPLGWLFAGLASGSGDGNARTVANLT